MSSRGMGTLDWVKEKVELPCNWTEQTRKLVPPRSTAMYRPFSVPLGTAVTKVGIWDMVEPDF